MTKRDPTYITATEMADRQREISVSEFFLKNRHLLGFDSRAKALLTTVKEAVDNALDACEEAGILPDIRVQVIEADQNVYRAGTIVPVRQSACRASVSCIKASVQCT